MYWIRSCSPRFAWPSTAAGSLDQGEQTSKDNDQGCKQATRAAALAHPSLRRSGPFCCARLCGFPSQKLFPVACPVLWGHGCRWKRMGFCGGKTFRWLPWAKHLEGKLCWSCGRLPTHTWWSNITCFLWIDKRSSLVFTALEKARTNLVASANQLPGVDGGHVKRVRPVSHVPICAKSLSGVAQRHPECSGCHIAG